MGDNGLGSLVVARAVEEAIGLASENGVGWVGTRNGNHAGKQPGRRPALRREWQFAAQPGCCKVRGQRSVKGQLLPFRVRRIVGSSAPIPAVRVTTIGRLKSTLRGRSVRCRYADACGAPGSARGNRQT